MFTGDGGQMAEIFPARLFCPFFGHVRASNCCGLSRCGSHVPEAQAQRPWLTGPAALRPVGSSQTGLRNRVDGFGRRTLNHCATRETPLAHLERSIRAVWNLPKVQVSNGPVGSVGSTRGTKAFSPNIQGATVARLGAAHDYRPNLSLPRLTQFTKRRTPCE